MSKKLKKLLDLLDNKIPNHESHVAAPQKGLRSGMSLSHMTPAEVQVSQRLLLLSVQSEATEELKPSRADSPPRLQDPQVPDLPGCAV